MSDMLVEKFFFLLQNFIGTSADVCVLPYFWKWEKSREQQENVDKDSASTESFVSMPYACMFMTYYVTYEYTANIFVDTRQRQKEDLFSSLDNDAVRHS